MDEIKMKELWQSSNTKLEEVLTITRKNAEDITRLKVNHFLSSMKPIKIFTVLVGLIWVGFGIVILINIITNNFLNVSLFFLLSAGIQILLTATALIIYIYQLIVIYQVDMGGSVVATQEKLSVLKSSTIWIARILFLQLPLWTTFYLNESMFSNGQTFLHIIQAIVTFAFAYLAIWLFFNIKYENKDKKWFRLLFEGKEWTPIIKSLELYREIEEFKKEKVYVPV
ncbi:MAG: hypothetical protein WKF35_05225 [Ferruginibacter sp.]